jgi:pSer/pThr/pTyr-binding forkhead associated (FHA) protein
MSGADLARLKIPQYRFSLQILDQGGQWREWEKIGVGGLKLGRSKGGPSIPGLSTMAVRHVRFYYEGGGLMVENLESVNGVYVRLTEPVELEDGRRFRVGNHVIDFRRAEPVEPVEPLRSEDEEEYWSADLGVVANLEFIRPDGTLGVRFPFLRGAERIVLGRGSRPGRPVDIPLPHDEWVSGSHAQVRHDSGRFFLEDLQSTNGTFIQLREPTPIKANDILMVGRVLLRIVSSAAF